MPTGYTAYIEDGNITTGKDFLLLRSRAFGIAMEVRDEPLSVPTPTHFEPNSYYQEKYEQAVKALEDSRYLTVDAARVCMRTEHNRRVKSAKETIEKMIALNERYAKIRGQVSAWIPPTEGHEGIKKFALEQIDMCVENEDTFAYYQNIIDTPADYSDKAVQRYIDEYIDSLERDVEYAKERYEEDIKRTNEKNQFMKEFIESLSDL